MNEEVMLQNALQLAKSKKAVGSVLYIGILSVVVCITYTGHSYQAWKEIAICLLYRHCLNSIVYDIQTRLLYVVTNNEMMCSGENWKEELTGRKGTSFLQ